MIDLYWLDIYIDAICSYIRIIDIKRIDINDCSKYFLFRTSAKRGSRVIRTSEFSKRCLLPSAMNIAVMSCHARNTDMRQNNIDDDSSDYGSEFTPDEEELLNELLARVAAAPEITTTTTTTDTITTTEETTSETQEQFLKEVLDDLQPLSDPLIVSDIEDYEVPHSARFPRVLGREAWSPARKRVWPQKQTATIAQKLWSSNSSTPVNIHAQTGGMFFLFSPARFA